MIALSSSLPFSAARRRSAAALVLAIAVVSFMSPAHAAVGNDNPTPSDAGAVAPEPAISIDPPSKDFGDVVVGTGSSQVFTATNTGTADLTFVAVSLVGARPTGVTVTADTCTGQSVAPNSTCAVQVTFAPGMAGGMSATLRFAHNAGSGTDDVALTGRGVAAPAPVFDVDPRYRGWASQTVGTVSGSQAFTVTNSGNAALTITAAALAGAAPGEFTKTADTCTGQSVSPGATCTVQVAFAPRTPGFKSALLSFTHNAMTSPQTDSVVVDGDAIAAPAPVPTPDPAPPVPAPVERCLGLAVTISGTMGSDVLTGTSGRDVIAGFGGNDRIDGVVGNDVICAGRGRDVITGGPGNDVIGAGRGKDRLSGNEGADILYGGPGNDRLMGGSGKDRSIGGAGFDRPEGR